MSCGVKLKNIYYVVVAIMVVLLVFSNWAIGITRPVSLQNLNPSSDRVQTASIVWMTWTDEPNQEKSNFPTVIQRGTHSLDNQWKKIPSFSFVRRSGSNCFHVWADELSYQSLPGFVYRLSPGGIVSRWCKIWMHSMASTLLHKESCVGLSSKFTISQIIYLLVPLMWERLDIMWWTRTVKGNERGHMLCDMISCLVQSLTKAELHANTPQSQC